MIFYRIKKIHKDGKGAVKSVDAELNLEDKDFKKTMKITWMAEAQDLESQFTPTKCVHFDHIITKGRWYGSLIGLCSNNWQSFIYRLRFLGTDSLISRLMDTVSLEG